MFSAQGDVILCGDFNARTGCLDDYIPVDHIRDLSTIREYCEDTDESQRVNIDNIVCPRGRQLLEMCKYSNLQIMNGRQNYPNNYTCHRYSGKSVVDYLLCHPTFKPSLMNFQIFDKNVFSDHCALSFSIHCNLPGTARQGCNDELIPAPGQFKWKPTLRQNYIESLKTAVDTDSYQQVLNDMVDRPCSIENNVHAFYGILKSAIQQNFRKSKPRPFCNFPKNEWYDNDCKEIKRKMRNLNKNVNTWHDRELLSQLQREYKRVVQLKKRNYHKIIARKVEDLNSKNPQEYWKFWKRYKKSNGSCNEYIDIKSFTNHYCNGQNINTDFYVDNFMEAIQTLMSRTDVACRPLQDGPLNDILNGPIARDEIKTAIRNLKNNKATGVDEIPAEFYKYSDGLLIEPITILFNTVFETEDYPSIWCEGIINPLYKNNSKMLPENYRKITIMSALGKLFETVLNNRLIYAQAKMKTDDPFQNGFKQRRRAIDNAYILNSVIEKSIATKRPLYVCFVDFKSAFDIVNRSALLYKMQKCGIGGKFLGIVNSMYNKARCRVKWKCKLDSMFSNLLGVLQGGVLSPTLFNIFISDLVKYLDPKDGVTLGDLTLFYLLFADDLVLISETSTGLQSLIKGLENFCRLWQVEVNLTKTKYTIFNKRYVLHQDVTVFTYNGKAIEECDEYKYVGTVFSNAKNRFATDHVLKRNRAIKAIYASKKSIREAMGNSLPVHLYLKIFDTQIRPILDYGCEIWSHGGNIRDLEIVHTDFLKQILGVKRQTPNVAIYGETGRFPLALKHKELVLKYWLLIVIRQRHSIV